MKFVRRSQFNFLYIFLLVDSALWRSSTFNVCDLKPPKLPLYWESNTIAAAEFGSAGSVLYFNFFSSANRFVAVCYCLALEGLHWPDWKPIWTGSQWYPRRLCGEGLVASPVNEGQLGLHRKPMRGRCLCVHCVLVRWYGQWKIFT